MGGVNDGNRTYLFIFYSILLYGMRSIIYLRACSKNRREKRRKEKAQGLQRLLIGNLRNQYIKTGDVITTSPVFIYESIN